MIRATWIVITTVSCTFAVAQPVEANCSKGFLRPKDSLYCVPIKQPDRVIWEACGNEPEHYGLFEAEPCMSSHSRKVLTDKFIEYCRKYKLPHLYK